MAEDKWKDRLKEREDQGNKRHLRLTEHLVDFVSNDYLGLARNQELYERIKKRVEDSPLPNKNGSGGSRLLSGNSEVYEQTENFLADLFDSEAALLFNSGYQANLALISSVPQKGDTVIYDQLSHICLKEGAWLSKAESVMFSHNDPEDLERKLLQAQGDKFVVIESVYSMDGDFSPLQEIIGVCEKYEAKIIIDEAHSTGVMGDRGSGWCVSSGLHEKIFARVYTFGKGMGVHGACIACSHQLKEFLVNFARPFIYTTALPLHSLLSIDESFKYLTDHQYLQQDLNDTIAFFKEELGRCLPPGENFTYPGSDTAIQPVIIAGNDRIKKVSDYLQAQNLDVRPILSPTVRKGTERLRISLHVHNTKDQIGILVKALKKAI